MKEFRSGKAQNVGATFWDIGIQSSLRVHDTAQLSCCHDVFKIPVWCGTLDGSPPNMPWTRNSRCYDPEIGSPNNGTPLLLSFPYYSNTIPIIGGVPENPTSKMHPKKRTPAQPFTVRLRNFHTVQAMEHFPCEATCPFNPKSDGDMKTDPLTGSWLVCDITCKVYLFISHVYVKYIDVIRCRSMKKLNDIEWCTVFVLNLWVESHFSVRKDQGSSPLPIGKIFYFHKPPINQPRQGEWLPRLCCQGEAQVAASVQGQARQFRAECQPGVTKNISKVSLKGMHEPESCLVMTRFELGISLPYPLHLWLNLWAIKV